MPTSVFSDLPDNLHQFANTLLDFPLLSVGIALFGTAVVMVAAAFLSGRH